MTQEIVVEGKQFISSKRASELSGYAQDYIGQLARKQLIDARRVGGLWYVLLDSLMSYQKQAEAYKPQPPVYQPEMNAAPDTVITFDGKDYISAARAASLTGYHQDYVGQLARSGTLLSKQIGNRWYVERTSILDHKEEKDRLLGSVQAESVGIRRFTGHVEQTKKLDNDRYSGSTPYFKYVADSSDLIPSVAGNDPQIPEPEIAIVPGGKDIRFQGAEKVEIKIPIRRIHLDIPTLLKPDFGIVTPVSSGAGNPRSSSLYVTAFGVLATIVIVLSIGFTSIKSSSTYALTERVRNTAASFEGANALQSIADFIEAHFIPQLEYHRE